VLIVLLVACVLVLIGILETAARRAAMRGARGDENS
jgi:hypothetical protein